jgi:hypothetical protein
MLPAHLPPDVARAVHLMVLVPNPATNRAPPRHELQRAGEQRAHRLSAARKRAVELYGGIPAQPPQQRRNLFTRGSALGSRPDVGERPAMLVLEQEHVTEIAAERRRWQAILADQPWDGAIRAQQRASHERGRIARRDDVDLVGHDARARADGKRVGGLGDDGRREPSEADENRPASRSALGRRATRALSTTGGRTRRCHETREPRTAWTPLRWLPATVTSLVEGSCAALRSPDGPQNDAKSELGFQG